MKNTINENEQVLGDTSDYQDFEVSIYNAQIEKYQKETAQAQAKIKFDEEQDALLKEVRIKLYDRLSERAGKVITKENLKELPDDLIDSTLDEAFVEEDNLVRTTHQNRPFSIIGKEPELENHVPAQNNTSLHKLLTAQATSRSTEILNECTSENTLLAHNGDLVYWQAWLGAIGFSFYNHITITEIKTFIIQHAEGLDSQVDKKLVELSFKEKLGTHKLSTIKRRVASLSVFLDKHKLPNDCHNQEIKDLLNKLTKKYGGSKPAGKAITKDILDDMLKACNKNKLIDLRDKALLLFTWASGGRRRSEVAAADMKNLTPTPENGYTYNITKSKTDQEQKGHTVPINGRAAQVLAEWLSVSKITTGAIFRAIGKGEQLGKALSPIDVYRIAKKRLKLAGYDESQYGAHSLRSGFVTEAGRKAKPLGDVMAMTTHKNVGTVMRYYQAGNVSNNSASNLAD
jgi:integrase